MNKWLRLLLILCLAEVVGILFMWNKARNYEKERNLYLSKLEHSATKQVTILKEFIEVDGKLPKRTIAIYLPENYSQDSIKRFPVFYFLDGQSLFDEKISKGDEWQIDELLDSLGKKGQDAIVVGIYNSNKRDSEYQPNFTPEVYDKRFTGNEHAEWIVNTLKPNIDQEYRTKSDAQFTVVGGSSFGGLMAYYMLTEHPDVIGGAIIMSPSFWVNEKSTHLDRKVKNIEKKLIYLSAGGKERGIINGVKYLDKVLQNRDLNENYRFEIEPNEVHRNINWRKMVRKAIPWMLSRMELNEGDAR